MEYICIQNEKTILNFFGKPRQVTKMALFYLPNLGKNRVYRGTIIDAPKNWKLITFKSFKKAKKLCDEINEIYEDDNFYPISKNMYFLSDKN